MFFLSLKLLTQSCCSLPHLLLLQFLPETELMLSSIKVLLFDEKEYLWLCCQILIYYQASQINQERETPLSEFQYEALLQLWEKKEK